MVYIVDQEDLIFTTMILKLMKSSKSEKHKS